MRKYALGKAILGGFLGTGVMTVAYLLANMSGVGHTWLAVDLARFLNGGLAPEPGSWASTAGLVWHFMNGTFLFPLVYAYWGARVLPGSAWMRGTLFGAILWFLMETVFRPIAGVGPFGQQYGDSNVTVLTPLTVHLLYGCILGALTGDPLPAGIDGGLNSDAQPHPQ